MPGQDRRAAAQGQDHGIEGQDSRVSTQHLLSLAKKHMQRMRNVVTAKISKVSEFYWCAMRPVTAATARSTGCDEVRS